MIAKNYRKFPDALIRQGELILAAPVSVDVSDRELSIVRLSFAASGAFLRTYAMKLATVISAAPAWFVSMANKARNLAKAIKAAIFPMFP